MNRKIYTLLFAFLFLVPSFMIAQNVLYVARNAPADGNDPSMITGLESLGYTVTVVDATAGYTTDSHTGQDIVVFGEFLSSGGVVPFADADFPLPCVSLEGYCTRGNRWGLLASDDDFGQIREDAQYVITPVIPDHYSIKVTSTHPIFANAGYGVGDEIAWSTEAVALPEGVWYNSLPQGTAERHADISGANADLHTFWTLQPESSDATNPLNHRLVIWGVHDNGLGATTEDFWVIMNNSIQWALGNDVPTNVIETDVLNSELKNAPNPFSTTTQISFNLKESAEIELRVFDALGRVVSSSVEPFTAGEQMLEYTNAGLQNGMYYYSLFADGLHAGSGKMMVAK